jgi:type VI secretion system FHA domain protein
MPLTFTVLRCPDSVPPETRTVTGGEFTVGRGPGVDWVLPDPERLLSKHHFAVAYRGGSWQIADTSTNGTTLNRDPAPIGQSEVRTLRDGDRLSLGSYEIEVRVAEDAAHGAGIGGGFGAPPPSRGASPFADPFALDPLAPPPPPRHAFDEAPHPGFGIATGAQLPHDFDPLAPEPGDAPFLGPTRSDHSSSLEDAFRPPATVGHMPLHSGGTLPGDDLLPDDWDKDLLEGINPTTAPAAPAPASLHAAPPPRPAAPPVAQTFAQPFAESAAPPQPFAQPAASPQPFASPATPPQSFASPAASPQPFGSPGVPPQPFGSPAVPPQPFASPAAPPQPVAQPMMQPVPQPVAQPMPRPVPQPVAHAFAQPMAQPIAQPVPQPVLQPLAHPADLDPFAEPGLAPAARAHVAEPPAAAPPPRARVAEAPAPAAPQVQSPFEPLPSPAAPQAPSPFDEPFDLEPAPSQVVNPFAAARAAAPPVPPPVAPPAPVSRPIAAAPAGSAAPTVAADSALLAAFLDGVGMSDVHPTDPVGMMRSLGQAFRTLVSGLRSVLIARASIKSEFRIEQTMIRARGNNPLKFSAGDDDALAALLGTGRRTDMTASAAVADALKDIRLHELASMAAMQSAVRTLLSGLDPVKLRAQADQGGGMSLLPAQKKARAWDAFEALHTRTVQALADDFDSVFGKAFARAYEQALDEVAAREK